MSGQRAYAHHEPALFAAVAPELRRNFQLEEDRGVEREERSVGTEEELASVFASGPATRPLEAKQLRTAWRGTEEGVLYTGEGGEKR